MRVAGKLAEIWDKGYTVVENFIDKETLTAAQDALWTIYPKPEDYFADPEKYPKFGKSQFSGIHLFPFPAWEINRLCVYPDLIDAAERFLKTSEIDLYKGELWAKYSGAVNYDQYHHRDYRNHTIVVPREDGTNTQMTTFILLSDVTDKDGPTKVVPLRETRSVPIGVAQTKFGTYFDKEVSIEGPAGSLMVYKTDVFHRPLELHSAEPLALRRSDRFQTTCWLAGQVRLARQIRTARLGQGDGGNDPAPARPFRVATDRRQLLERTDAARRPVRYQFGLGPYKL
jgi:hypothetical protein